MGASIKSSNSTNLGPAARPPTYFFAGQSGSPVACKGDAPRRAPTGTLQRLVENRIGQGSDLFDLDRHDVP
ncbi:MAG: hypothetical protein WDZ48_02225, partial [Pirellulales bacterium]